MRLVLYTGKGGVGKTTTAAATAALAAQRGLASGGSSAAAGTRVLVASADAAHSLGDVLQTRLGPEPTALAPGLDGVELDAHAEIARHWGSIRDYLVRLFRYQGIDEVVAEELAQLPGAEELTTLLAVEHYGRSGGYDLVVLDCAPTDSTLRLVTLPEVAHGAFRLLLRVQRSLSMLVTPLARELVPVPLPGSEVFRDLEQLLYRRLRDLRRLLLAADTSVRIVVTPERMVVDEARRAYTDLCLFGLGSDAVVMNRLLPPEAAGEAFFRDWSRRQRELRQEVETCFAPLKLLDGPLQDDEVLGLDRLVRHGEALFGDCDPAALLSSGPRPRFSRLSDGYRLELPLPGAEASGLEVTKVDDDLVVRAGAHRRAIKLPRRVAPLDVMSAVLAAGCLDVRFGSTPEVRSEPLV